MTELYLIRHTQAEGNLYHMMQGHWDGDITSLGQRQIEALAKRFENIKIDAVYSSDLRRAMKTANAAARHAGLPIHKDARLREINVGPWEAQFFGNAIEDDPEGFRKFITEPEEFYLEGAETYQQVGERAYEALCQISEAHDGDTVAVVSHGVALRCILSIVSGTPLKDMPLCPNTGMTHLFYEDGRFTVDYMNDASHLSEDLLAPRITTSLRHVWIDPAEEEDYYLACYEDAWLAAHGDLSGFTGTTYLNSAREHFEADPQSVYMLMDRDTPAGLIDLDVYRGSHMGCGWISLLYLNDAYRHQGLGIQLLARAIVKYEELGRHALRLHVSDDNVSAMAFYKANGFKALSYEPNGSHKLYTMEKKLEGEANV